MYWNGAAACARTVAKEPKKESGENVAGKKSGDPSPESVARANRQRLAFEEGVRAMADVEREAAAVRKNMERLRTLRQAKEAEQRAEALRTGLASSGAATRTKRKKRVST
jgi:hypothetical protein